MNNLHGSFPSVFGNMSSLENLDLNGNTLGGSLSQSLTACKKLEVLDVGNNEISGSIPEAIGELESLKHLNLSHNSLSGPIPSSLVNLTELEALDLSFNQLTGVIPPQLASLTSLEKLNLSQNLLRGPIPQGNQIQTFDNASYIGNQELCGPPLSKKCNGDDGDGNDHHDDSEPEFDGALFDWAFAGAGYGCGLVIGISAAYIMFTIRKPRWLVDMIDKWIRWQQQNRRWRPAITF
ncbi:unnamed protein product [Linum tenue]|uniref:Uncharacterized protein n=1 Tax=Linum tenue TaxID=586396 RepID=A0AAV0RDE0_9ROSI|nr:unnamed protein product [Linum tenue]